MKKPALHLALCLIALISSWAHAQTITIPAQTITAPLTINGTTVKMTFTVPAQTIKMPKPSVIPTTIQSSLPDGLAFTNGVLTVAGSIKATSIDLTGGSALPTSASGLYLLQMTGGFLQPVPYVPYSPTPAQ